MPLHAHTASGEVFYFCCVTHGMLLPTLSCTRERGPRSAVSAFGHRPVLVKWAPQAGGGPRCMPRSHDSSVTTSSLQWQDSLPSSQGDAPTNTLLLLERGRGGGCQSLGQVTLQGFVF